MTEYMLSVDPGVECGWALWPWRASVQGSLHRPLATGNVIPAKKLEWMERTQVMAGRMHRVYSEAREREGHMSGRIVLTVCEYPEFWESEGGQIAAKEGNLVKLAVAAGRIFELAQERGSDFEFVPVNTWKGQLNKAQVEHRLRARLGEALEGVTNHALDAVGIGLWRKGHF